MDLDSLFENQYPEISDTDIGKARPIAVRNFRGENKDTFMVKLNFG